MEVAEWSITDAVHTAKCSLKQTCCLDLGKFPVSVESAGSQGFLRPDDNPKGARIIWGCCFTFQSGWRSPLLMDKQPYGIVTWQLVARTQNHLSLPALVVSPCSPSSLLTAPL